MTFRSRYRHSSGSNLVSQSQAGQYCRMNKSNSTGNQQIHPYGSPLHSYVSSQDLFARYVFCLCAHVTSKTTMATPDVNFVNIFYGNKKSLVGT